MKEVPLESLSEKWRIAPTVEIGAPGDFSFSAIEAGNICAMNPVVAAGALKEDIIESAFLGAPVGAAESLPIELLFDRFPLPIAGKLAGIAAQILAEGSQEAASQFLQNAIEGRYDETQSLTEGLGESAAVGGAVGGIVEGAKQLLETMLPGKGRARGAGGRDDDAEAGTTGGEPPAPTGGPGLDGEIIPPGRDIVPSPRSAFDAGVDEEMGSREEAFPEVGDERGTVALPVNARHPRFFGAPWCFENFSQDGNRRKHGRTSAASCSPTAGRCRCSASVQRLSYYGRGAQPAPHDSIATAAGAQAALGQFGCKSSMMTGWR